MTATNVSAAAASAESQHGAEVSGPAGGAALAGGVADVPEMLEWALRWFDWGYLVYPVCWPDERGSCACGGGHTGKAVGKAPLFAGYQHLRSTREDVIRWWTEKPHANIGFFVRTTGMLVGDLDGDEAIEEARGYHLPPGPVIRTGRQDGRGEHRHYRRSPSCPATNTTRKGACGPIDVLAN